MRFVFQLAIRMALPLSPESRSTALAMLGHFLLQAVLAAHFLLCRFTSPADQGFLLRRLRLRPRLLRLLRP